MKPSERIVQIIKEMAREEAKNRGTYLGWEGLEDLTQMIVLMEFRELFPLAVIKFLDEQTENIKKG